MDDEKYIIEEGEKSVNDIVHEAERMVTRILNNNIPPQTCSQKIEKAKWKREKVVQELFVKLGVVGPSEVK